MPDRGRSAAPHPARRAGCAAARDTKSAQTRAAPRRRARSTRASSAAGCSCSDRVAGPAHGANQLHLVIAIDLVTQEVNERLERIRLDLRFESPHRSEEHTSELQSHSFI